MTDDNLNKLMAEKVMGWYAWHDKDGYRASLWRDKPDDTGEIALRWCDWNPATDANDALRVVEAMRAKEWYFALVFDCKFNRVTFWRSYLQFGIPTTFSQDFTDSVARAICEAAAKAVGE
jgi:hypothetical protein